MLKKPEEIHARPVVLPTASDGLLSTALALLESATRHTRALPDDGYCSFDYINLKADNTQHQPFLDILNALAKQHKLRLAHPRISRYRVGDYMTEHVDTVPDVELAGVLTLQSQEPRLLVMTEQGYQLLPDTPGQPVLFDPKQKHQVLQIKQGLDRVVVNFWLCRHSQ